MPSTTIIGERRRSPVGSVYEATGVGPDPLWPGNPERQRVLVNHVGGPDSGAAVSTGWAPLKTPGGRGWEAWDVVGEPAVPEPPAPDWQNVAVKFSHAIESLRGSGVSVPIPVAARILDAEAAYKAALKVAHKG